MATKKSAVRGALTTNNAATVAKEPEAKVEEAATPYAQALSRITPLQPILAGLAHRNRNQHRRAAWWRHFGMLRRNCARLADELVSADAAARKDAARAAKTARAESKKESKKRRREELASGALRTVKSEREDDDDVAARGVVAGETEGNVRHAAWIRDVLVPKCYLAFSQLTADPQFAPLGIVLLGALAQIKAACDIAAPRPAAPVLSSPSARDVPEAAAESRPSAVESVTTIPKTGNTATLPTLEPGPKANERESTPGTKKDGRDDEGGGGKTISRADVERATAQRKKGKEAGKVKVERDKKTATSSDRAKPGASPEASGATASLPSSKRQVSSAREGEGGEEIARPAKKTKTAAVTRAREKGTNDDKDKDKKTTKKKKTKKGDEFDDLFKGLF
ncbi:hypothetical protein F5Y12DRAFT_481836 [Xylaria sp. FL1777]|nr:hypothetical protein F5Y12DRAFT_481836 [Xylaria sp. FL1777]